MAEKEEAVASASSPRDRAVWPAMVTSASLVAQLVAGKATRDALFLTHFDLKLLPAAMIGGAALSAVSVALVSRALSRTGPARVVPAAFAISALLFLGEGWLSLERERAAAVAVYAHTAVFGAAIGSAFWSLVNERFDPHEAKRRVGRIASGGTAGGVIGGLIAWRASAHLSVPLMLALLATISAVGLWGSILLAPRERRSTTDASLLVGGGVRALGDTPYLRDLALLVGVGAIMQALLDWLLSHQVTREYGQGQSLLGFFALFNMVVGVLSFAAQTGLTRTVLERRGLGGTVKLQPMSVAVGVVAALLAPPLLLFPAILALRVMEGVTRSSLYRSAYELFYTPLPPAKKRATKTLIDVGVDRVATALGSAVLFAVAHVFDPPSQARVVLFCVLGSAAAGWIISARLQDGYVSALAASLRSGAVTLEDVAIEDLTTRRTLAETTALLDRDKLLARIEQFQLQKTAGLDAGASAGAAPPGPTSEPAPPGVASSRDLGAYYDPQDGVVARAAALRSNDAAAIKRALGSPLPPTLAPFAIPLLANDAVARDAVRALRRAAPRVTGALVDHLLALEVDARVRRRIPRILKTCHTERAIHGLLLALRDPVFEVRVQVGGALSHLVEARPRGPSGRSMDRGVPTTVDVEEVLGVVLYELTAGRTSWPTATADPTSDLGRHTPDATPSPSSSDRGRSAPPRSGHAGASDLRRGLAHVFALLGLVLDREPLSIAHRALSSDDPTLRGTALEYLEVVLSPRIRGLLLPLLGDVKPDHRARERGSKELAAELLRSRSGASSS